MKDGTIRGIDLTPFLTQVPMEENMDRQQSDCPGINLFRFTESRGIPLCLRRWFIRMLCLLELIVDRRTQGVFAIETAVNELAENSIWIR